MSVDFDSLSKMDILMGTVVCFSTGWKTCKHLPNSTTVWTEFHQLEFNHKNENMMTILSDVVIAYFYYLTENSSPSFDSMGLDPILWILFTDSPLLVQDPYSSPHCSWRFTDTQKHDFDEHTNLTLSGSYLFPSCCQAWIPTNLANKVAFTLTMSTKVDGAWLNMNIHEVIDNFTLNVILDTVDKEALPHIYHLNEREVSAIKKHQI